MAVVSYLDWTKQHLVVVGCGDYSNIPEPDAFVGSSIVWEARYNIVCEYPNTHWLLVKKEDKEHPALQWLVAEGVLRYVFSSATRIEFAIQSIEERNKKNA